MSKRPGRNRSPVGDLAEYRDAPTRSCSHGTTPDQQDEIVAAIRQSDA